MSHTTRLYAPGDLKTHSSKPLDEAVWRAWIEKNLDEDRSRAAGRTKIVNWICIGVLASAIVTSSHLSLIYVPTYQVVVRLAIGVGDRYDARSHSGPKLWLHCSVRRDGSAL